MKRFFGMMMALGLVIATGATVWAEMKILAPPEGYVSRQGILWVVVQSEKVPEIRLDGTVCTGIVSEGDIHHVKITGPTPDGSMIEARTGKAMAQRKVFLFPGGGKRPKFHGTQDPT